MSVFRKLLYQLQRDESDSSLWMLPYSTLMLVLMIFFAAIYGLSHLESVEYETAIVELGSTTAENQEGRKKEVALAQNMRKIFEERDMSDLVAISISARYIKLKLTSPVLFDIGKAELKKDILPVFDELSKHLQGMNNRIIVEGHTDDIPIHSEQFRSNWELSAARAFSVINFLISRGIGSGRLVAHGYGEFRPAFSNDSEIGRAKNRRIEITIIRGDV